MKPVKTGNGLGRALEVLNQVDDEEVADSLSDLREALQEVEQATARTPTLAVLGGFSTGKSALLNALLNEYVLPTDPLPTTARCCHIQYGTRRNLVLNRTSGSRELRDIEDYRRYGDKSTRDPAELGLADVDGIDVFLPYEPLRTLSFLDTPGLGEADPDAEQTSQALGDADAILWCTSALQAWKGDEVRIWSNRIPADLKAASILVVTRTDQLNRDEDRAKLRKRIENETKGLFARIVMVGLGESERILKKGAQLDDAALARAGLNELQTAIREVVLARAETLRQAWALRQGRVFFEACIADAKGRRAGLDTIETQVKRFQDEVRRAWKDSTRVLKDASKKAVKGYEALMDSAVDKARTICTEQTFVRPVQVVEEGWFTNDYKIDYEENSYWNMEFDEIQTVHQALWDETNAIDKALSEAITAAFDAFAERVGNLIDETGLSRMNDASGDDAQFWGRMSVVNSARQLEARFSDFDAFFSAELQCWTWRALGSIEGGGLYGLWALRMLQREDKKYQKRPSPNTVAGREWQSGVNQWFSFRTVVDRLPEYTDRLLEVAEGQLNAQFENLDDRLKPHIDPVDTELDVLTRALAKVGESPLAITQGGTR